MTASLASQPDRRFQNAAPIHDKDKGAWVLVRAAALPPPPVGDQSVALGLPSAPEEKHMREK